MDLFLQDKPGVRCYTDLDARKRAQVSVRSLLRTRPEAYQELRRDRF